MDTVEQYESLLNGVPSCDTSDPESQSRYRGTYFACILYPDNYSHMKFLQYVQARPQYDVAYIFHHAEPDPEEDSHDKQDHYHVLVHVRKSITVGSFVKFFSPWINYAICVKDYISYLAYMLHDTPCSLSCIYHYKIDDLKGEPSLWKPLIQKSKFVQYGEFFSYYNPGMSVNEVLDVIRSDRGEAEYQRFVEYVCSNSFLVVSLTNQDNNLYFRRLERMEQHYQER